MAKRNMTSTSVDTSSNSVPRRDPAAAKRPGSKLSITVIILTLNEEIHIERCLSRIAPHAQRLIVIDSFSTDQTPQIAARFGAEVHQRAFKHQADQFQWALDNCDITTDWILRLDADEYLEEAAIDEIGQTLDGLAANITGLEFKLKVIFKGRWIRFGGYYSTILLRMWRTDIGYYEQRWMDEKVILKEGATQRITGGDLVDESLKDIGWWTQKHNRYATRQMVDFINLEYELFPRDKAVDIDANKSWRWRRFLRNKLFGRAPLYWRSVMYFVYRYFIRLGFLDGRQGFVWHFLQGFWFFVLIDAKIDEAREFIKENGIEAFKDHLRSAHGIEL